MEYEDYFVLHILNCFNGERSVSAIYHLLKGKRTSQTIQDGFLFQVHPYFQSLPYITRQELNRIIGTLEKGEFIIKRDMDHHYSLTPEGSKCLDEFRDVHMIPTGLNGWFYGGLAVTFWKRLSLLVQTLSYLHAGVSQFIPITRDESTLKWVKGFLFSKRIKRNDLLDSLFHELDAVWSELPQTEADLLTHRLSGLQYDGLSIQQLSDATGKTPCEIILLIFSGLHRSVQMVYERNEFSLLKQLLGQDMRIGLTESAQKTLDMLHSGWTTEEIARYRRLKVTTIQDHIVEAAFCDPMFSITPYVQNDIYQMVVRAIAGTNMRKLSTIKQLCPDEVQYFHIRLVLARERIK